VIVIVEDAKVIVRRSELARDALKDTAFSQSIFYSSPHPHSNSLNAYGLLCQTKELPGKTDHQGLELR
jgi:hypothetical protein